MLIARQYRLYDPIADKVVLAIVPKFIENQLFKLESSETPEVSNPEGVSSETELPEGDTIIVDTSYLEDLGIASLGGLESTELSELNKLSELEGPEDSELGGDKPLEDKPLEGTKT
jgi:hypothetical protein